MTQIIAISCLYSGLLLLGILDISHVGTSSAPVDTTTMHHMSTLAHTEDLETKAKDMSHAATLPAHVDANTVHNTTHDSVADTEIKPTQGHKETTTGIKDPPGTIKHHLSTLEHGNGHPEVPATTAGMKDPPGTIKHHLSTIKHHLSTIKHGNGHPEVPATTEPEKQYTTITATIENKRNENSSSNATGIIIGCFVGLFIIFIIFALITILRKKKLSSYSFEPANKSPEDAGIPLNNVKA